MLPTLFSAPALGIELRASCMQGSRHDQSFCSPCRGLCGIFLAHLIAFVFYLLDILFCCLQVLEQCWAHQTSEGVSAKWRSGEGIRESSGLGKLPGSVIPTCPSWQEGRDFLFVSSDLRKRLG